MEETFISNLKTIVLSSPILPLQPLAPFNLVTSCVELVCGSAGGYCAL